MTSIQEHVRKKYTERFLSFLYLCLSYLSIIYFIIITICLFLLLLVLSVILKLCKFHVDNNFFPTSSQFTKPPDRQ